MTEIPLEDCDRPIKLFESSGYQARTGTANVVGEWSDQLIWVAEEKGNDNSIDLWNKLRKRVLCWGSPVQGVHHDRASVAS